MIDARPDQRPDLLPPLPRHLSADVTRAALRIQHRLLAAAREALCQEGCIELLAPLIGPVTDPGVRGSKQVDIDYYGWPYKLMTSGILYKQASLLGFEKIFFIAPNVRLEPPVTAGTRRHLAEFHQIDLEIAGASRQDVMDLAERVVKHIVRAVLDELPEALETLGREAGAFAALLDGPFDVMTHQEAVAALGRLEHDQSPDGEIDWQGEERLSRTTSRPFFIVDYPKGSRGFYDRESQTQAGVLRNFDLLAPGGFGELASGGEREFEYARLVRRMRETGENPAKYAWYLDMMREGVPSSAGFGIGVERLTRYVAGLDAVWQASAYPKLPGVASP